MVEVSNPRGPGRQWLAALTVALCIAAATPACADDDLPTRVGRVSEFAGPLYLAPQDRASDWAAISLNYPITGGDYLSVAPEGHAEVDFGSGQLRLVGETRVQVTALDENRFGLFVASGRIILRLRTLDAGDSATIDTPDTQIQLDRAGLYRVEVAPDRRETILTVRDGEAEVRFSGGTQQVLPGQAATVAASNPAEVAIGNGVGTDGFDAWSALRDRAYDTSPSAAYASREMVGAVDLGYYGSWENYPTYGNVWFPTTVAVGWAPYRFGRWVWRGPWGWTWVDAAPWGYAPFHYGRWVYVSGRWGWCPGAFVRRPVWAPALVAWFGGPAWAFSTSLGAPVFGWVPLSWGEPIRPHWHCSADCWRRLNHPYAVAATDPAAAPTHFVNSDVPGAVTAVAGSVLAASKPVAANLVRVSQTSVASAPVLASGPTSGASPSPVARRPAGTAANAAAATESRTRVAAPLVDHGGRTVNVAPPRVYGGVTDGRGAYTGVAPTPGPKRPVNVDRGYPLPPPVTAPVAPPAARPASVPAFAPVPAVVPGAPLIVPTHNAPAGQERSTSGTGKGGAPIVGSPAPGGAPAR